MHYQDLKIGIFCGGDSAEREVSLRSGDNVFRIFKENGYNKVKLIDFTNDKFQNNLIDWDIDVIYNVLHGDYGENGKIQALFEWKNIPYTGSGIQASAISMNKILTKHILHSLNLPTPQLTILDKNYVKNITFSYPFFIKNKSLGSSIGIFKIQNQEELNKIIPQLNDDFFVEEGIEGREITVGLIQTQNQWIELPILEIVPQTSFYDYQAKYVQGGSQFYVPARLDYSLAYQIIQDAKKLYTALNCVGAARIDMMVKGNQHYILEINTSSGMTELSDIPMQSKAYGLSEIEMLECILESAWMKKD